MGKYSGNSPDSLEIPTSLQRRTKEPSKMVQLRMPLSWWEELVSSRGDGGLASESAQGAPAKSYSSPVLARRVASTSTICVGQRPVRRGQRLPQFDGIDAKTLSVALRNADLRRDLLPPPPRPHPRIGALCAE